MKKEKKNDNLKMTRRDKDNFMKANKDEAASLARLFGLDSENPKEKGKK